MSSPRPTIHDLAREAGVSTATVDRALNARAGVTRRTRDLVLAAARRIGYLAEPSSVADAAPEPARVVVLLPAGTNAFIATLGDQIARQAEARGDVAALVERIEGFDPGGLADRLDALEPAVQGLALVALDHPLVREAIRRLSGRGVAVVTLASDIQGVPRTAYVGIDNRQAGRLAGHLMGRFLGARPGKVAFFEGSRAYRGHEEREMGFRAVLAEERPGLAVVAVREILDDRARAHAETLAVLDAHPDLAAIYNAGGGTAGIGRALVERGRAREVVVIAHEATESNKRLLLDGTLDAVIDQNPRVEAREALAALVGAIQGAPHAVVPPRLMPVFRENLPED